MLFYSSIHPEWENYDREHTPAERQRIYELLSVVAMNHPRHTTGCFDQLEEAGIILGSGAFEVALIQQEPSGIIPEEGIWIQRVVCEAKKQMHLPLWYCFDLCGQLYILVCLPRLREEAQRTNPWREKIYHTFERLCQGLISDAPRLRMILSDLQYTEAGIFQCFNNLRHARDYYDFCSDTPHLIQLDSERQLHGAFLTDLSAYRQFSVSMAEQLFREICDPELLSRTLVDTLMESSGNTVESLHHHIQIFMLTFTEYLGSTGLVDMAYLRRHNIVYRSLAFETEGELWSLLQQLLDELRRQYQVLQTLGRQKRIQAVREYVELHISHPELTIASVSSEFGISAAQLSKQFRYYFGVSLHRFLQQSRFALAQRLIDENPAWSMRRVAQEAGYTDLSTMYRAFRQFGDITPGALKSSARKKAPPLQENEKI